jgi:predicted nucleic acid-binding protein
MSSNPVPPRRSSPGWQDEKAAALIWARLMAEGTATGRKRSALDMIIAAIAEANDCVVVSDNEKDFAGLEIVNPLRTGT